MSNIHTNIKVLRTESRLSQEEFAEKIGVDTQKVVLWEKGKLDPTSNEIKIMCPVLRIHEEDFLERDIMAERNEAGRRMKHSDDRKNYDWYYGSKTMMAFYISYLIIVPVVMALVYFLYQMQIKDILIPDVSTPENIQEIEALLNMYKWLYTLISGGIVTSVYVLIYLFKNRIIVFRYWYIFIIGTLISVLIIVCTMAMIGVYGFAFYKGVIKKGKNR